jgi:hypothetical protein
MADYAAGRTAPIVLVQELYRLRRELHHIGVNLNQLTRAAHAGALDLAELAATVHRLAAAVREALMTLATHARWQPAPDPARKGSGKGARRR